MRRTVLTVTLACLVCFGIGTVTGYRYCESDLSSDINGLKNAIAIEQAAAKSRIAIIESQNERIRLLEAAVATKQILR